MLKILEFKKQEESIFVVNHLGMPKKDQIYRAAIMVLGVCESKFSKIEREDDMPIVVLSLDEKKELSIASSEDQKETIKILTSSIILNLMSDS